MVVVSGSCSPVTARQIQGAQGQGFAGVSLDPVKLLEGGEGELEKASAQALKALENKKGVILHTALGPSDARVKASSESIRKAGPQRLGAALGKLLGVVLERGKIRRAVVVGGDTSGFAARELGFRSLEMLGPIHPGSPLCKGNKSGSFLDGLEILFKGGQVGRDDVFDKIRQGKP